MPSLQATDDPMADSDPAIGLYLHFPFCLSKCAYCDFNSQVAAPGEKESYLQALHREIVQRAEEASGRTVASVYLGGGTPTVYPVEALASTVDLLREHYFLSPEAEVTCEANPGTVDEGYLAELRAGGVNRLSLGVQSFHDQELRLLGRIHSAAEARQAVQAAREAGFANLSLDLISGLPGQTVAAWEDNLAQALALETEHLSCYGLSIPVGTPLHEAVVRGDLEQPGEEVGAEMLERTHYTLTSAGYEHYEISNYARPDYEGRHNLNYWHQGEYLGFGVSAWSYQQGWRWRNLAETDEYGQRLNRGESVEAESETLPPKQRLGETMMLALRTAAGISPAELREQFPAALVAKLEPVAEQMRTAGLLRSNPGRWRPTLRGMLFNNQLAGAFLEAAE